MLHPTCPVQLQFSSTGSNKLNVQICYTILLLSTIKFTFYFLQFHKTVFNHCQTFWFDFSFGLYIRKRLGIYQLILN